MSGMCVVREGVTCVVRESHMCVCVWCAHLTCLIFSRGRGVRVSRFVCVWCESLICVYVSYAHLSHLTVSQFLRCVI